MISRRNFILGLLGAGLSGAAGDLFRHETPFPAACVVRPVSVPAPVAWRGKTALFISDLHYGYCFGAKESAALARLVRQHTPDLILMGGDLAQTPETDLGGFFAHWTPGCPTLFAPGNHDTRGNADSAVLAQARQGGLIVLCNSAEAWNGLTFIGLASALRMPQKRSLLRVAGPKIVLAHEPDTWDRDAEPAVLQLAGHTHAGQVRLFGRALVLPALGRKYAWGTYAQRRSRTLIVSAGIGCTNVPARINCPPEIVQLRFA